MTLVKTDEGTALVFSALEWALLQKGCPLVKISGYSGGYFRIDVKMTEIEDPYTTDTIADHKVLRKKA